MLFLFLELLLVRQLLFMINWPWSDKYRSYHMYMHCTKHFGLSTLFPFLSILVLSLVPTQFWVDWLQSKYCNLEWSESVDFLRVDGYTQGKSYLCTCELHLLCASTQLTLFCLLWKESHFFRSDTERIHSLLPGFWSLHCWKATLYMHHDFSLLEQVCYHKF